jgi:hypothetical protein
MGSHLAMLVKVANTLTNNSNHKIQKNHFYLYVTSEPKKRKKKHPLKSVSKQTQYVFVCVLNATFVR